MQRPIAEMLGTAEKAWGPGPAIEQPDARIGHHGVVAGMGPTKSTAVDRLAGNVLRLARLERGMTQRELADVAGVAQSTIARIESGAR